MVLSVSQACGAIALAGVAQVTVARLQCEPLLLCEPFGHVSPTDCPVKSSAVMRASKREKWVLMVLRVPIEECGETLLRSHTAMDPSSLN